MSEKNNNKESEVELLKKKLSLLIKGLKEEKQITTKLKEENDLLKSELEDKKILIKKINEENEILKYDLEEKKVLVKKMKEEYQELMQEKIPPEKLSSFFTSLEKEQNIETPDEEKFKLKKENEEFCQKIKILEKDKNYYMKQLEIIEKQKDSEINSLKSQLNLYKDSIIESEEKSSKLINNIKQEQLISNDKESKIAKLQKEIDFLLKDITKLCQQIYDKRKKIATVISKKIISELEDLNMKNSQFEISVEKSEISRTGFDKLEFMFSANKGEKLYPLSLVASGGEISRVMLALSTTISDNYNVGTIIFDEIDTGTSGKTGEKIGKKLKSLSDNRQIISISHLAQIASNADNHIKIYKETEKGRNITKAKVLNANERIEEIAKIISGEKITEHAIKHAEELLNDK